MLIQILIFINYLYCSKNNNKLNDNIVSFDYSLDSLENNTSMNLNYQIKINYLNSWTIKKCKKKNYKEIFEYI